MSFISSLRHKAGKVKRILGNLVCRSEPVSNTDKTVSAVISVPDDICIYFSHNIGGGADHYLNERIKTDLDNSITPVTVKFDIGSRLYLIDIYQTEEPSHFTVQTFENALIELFPHCNKVVINELVTYPNLTKTLELLCSYIPSYKPSLEFLFHDYHCLCPHFNLINQYDQYCDLPSNSTICNECYLTSHFMNSGCHFEEIGALTIEAYRAAWQQLLEQANDIIVFSNSSKELLRRVYPNLNNVTVRPHATREFPDIYKPKDTNDPIVIATMGNLSTPYKGLNILIELVTSAQKRNPEICFVHIGEMAMPVDSSNFSTTGMYKPENLPSIFRQYKPDVVFFPSIWPETFSYTCSEIIAMGYPLVTFNLGAQEEKANDYEKGKIISINSSAEEVLNQLIEFVQEMRGESV